MKLDISKKYYLSHPCTTHGDIRENKEREAAIAKKLEEENPGIMLIRPLATIAEDEEWNKAMEISFQMLNNSEAIILSGEWFKSKGCQAEFCYAKEKGIETREYSEEVETPLDKAINQMLKKRNILTDKTSSFDNRDAVGFKRSGNEEEDVKKLIVSDDREADWMVER